MPEPTTATTPTPTDPTGTAPAEPATQGDPADKPLGSTLR